MIEQLQTFWDATGGRLEGQPYLQALAIFGLFLLLAKLAQWIITGGIRSLARRTKTTLDDRLLELVKLPIFATTLLVGIGLAGTRLGLDPVYERLGLRLLETIALLLWLIFALRAAAVVLNEITTLENKIRFIEPRTVALVDNALKVVLIGGGIYLFCVVWGIPVAGWLATGGVVGLVLGLAARDSLSNLFAGMFILADAPYEVGDFINLDSGERGQVTDVGLRSTRLLTRDDIEVTVPNSVIANAKIMNESGGHWAKERIRVKVGVAYGSDIDQVRAVLVDVARTHPLIVDDPAPRVRFRAFGDSSLDLELLGWIDEPVLRGKALDRLYTEVYKRFQAEGIEIPFPQRDVHLHQAPGTGHGESS